MGQLSGMMSYLQNDVYIDRVLLSSIISSITIFEEYLISCESGSFEWLLAPEIIFIDLENPEFSGASIPFVYQTAEDRINNLFVLSHTNYNTSRSGLITRFTSAAVSSGYDINHPTEYLLLLDYVGQLYDMFNITLNQKINL